MTGRGTVENFLSRLAGRHLVGAYLVVVVVVNVGQSMRRDAALPSWTFWLLDVPLVIVIFGMTGLWIVSACSGLEERAATQTMKRHSEEPGEGLGTSDSPEICAKIIWRYATLREEYLNGKSDSDFNSSSTTDQEHWLMCEIGGLRKAADLLSSDTSDILIGLPSRYWDQWPGMVTEIRSGHVENRDREHGAPPADPAQDLELKFAGEGQDVRLEEEAPRFEDDARRCDVEAPA